MISKKNRFVKRRSAWCPRPCTLPP
jgi:hypothetical protein